MTRKQQFAAQVKRVKSAVKRAQKQGYTVPASIIPKSPKKITEQSIERAKSITPEFIRRMSVPRGQSTSLHEQLTRQVNRIKKAKASLEKQNFIVPEVEELIGKIPTRLTKEYITELKKLTPEVIRYKSEWVNTETGELFKGGQGWRMLKAKKKGIKKPTEAPIDLSSRRDIPDERDAAYDSLIHTLQMLPNQRAQKLEHLLKRYEAKFGYKEMGAFLARAIRNGDMINYRLLVSGSDGEVWDNVSRFLSHLPDIGQHELEDIEEVFFDMELDFME